MLLIEHTKAKLLRLHSYEHRHWLHIRLLVRGIIGRDRVKFLSLRADLVYIPKAKTLPKTLDIYSIERSELNESEPEEELQAETRFRGISVGFRLKKGWDRDCYEFNNSYNTCIKKWQKNKYWSRNSAESWQEFCDFLRITSMGNPYFSLPRLLLSFMSCQGMILSYSAEPVA